MQADDEVVACAAASKIGWKRLLPHGVSLRTGSSTCTKRSSPPIRSISSTAASVSSVGTTSDARSRSSRSSHSAFSQSLTARVSAAS